MKNLVQSIWKGTTSWRLNRSQSISLYSWDRHYTHTHSCPWRANISHHYSLPKSSSTLVNIRMLLGELTSRVQSHRPPSSLPPSSCYFQISSQRPGLCRWSHKSVPPAVISSVSFELTSSHGIPIFVRETWHVFTYISIVLEANARFAAAFFIYGINYFISSRLLRSVVLFVF